jgi:integrase/recombinase XerD
MALGGLVAVDDVGRVIELAGVRYLNPADQIFDEMLEGWRNQQLSRNLAFSTIEQRLALVRGFQAAVNEYPWQWAPVHVDEFFGDQRAERGSKQSTLRSYQNALRTFCNYIGHPDYGWEQLCEKLFNAYPAQVCFDWNTAQHVQASERGPGNGHSPAGSCRTFLTAPTMR